MAEHFDVLVVGAGSAGCVVAARLSADPACRVGLVEAGALPSDPDIADPLKWTQIAGRSYDWAYRTVPQPFTAGRRHDWPRGRVLGGSSCLHAMAYVRGHPDDFEPWRAAGGDRWSAQGLRPGFERSASHISGDGAAGRNGGPLDVWLPDADVSPLVRDFIAAGRALGVPGIDSHNGENLIGTTPNALNIRGGRRLSVADAYLGQDVRDRPNLVLRLNHQADRLEIERGRAVTLLAVCDGEVCRLSADRIVLCAGAVGSPLLLMRSGVGDPDTLAQAGIACRQEHPGVGANLQDHLLVFGNVYRACRPVPPSRLQHSESLMYLDSANMAATSGVPDIVVACVVAPAAVEGLDVPDYGAGFTLLCGATHPQSRGRITPGGPGLHESPIIDPRYLQARQDRVTMRRALRVARELGHHRAMDAWRGTEMHPGPDVHSDADLYAFIARAASTHHHPAGTCRMGQDSIAVVDADLGVHGFDNLFVVDASVMPTLPSGPINAAVVAIAETWTATVGAPDLVRPG
ncbi:MAG: GMC family oxidoreductase [Hyphomicrobiales bacterium]